jgi:hypothetical protein
VSEFFAGGLLSGPRHRGGGVGEQGVAGGVPADAGVAEGADQEGGFYAEVVGGTDRVGRLLSVLRAAVGDAGAA